MARTLYQVKALYDFEAGTSEELTFPEGAILGVIADSNADWYEAEYEGMKGMVPKNYFEPLQDGGYDDFDNSATSPSVNAPKKVQVVIVQVLYAYDAQQPDEMSVQPGDILQVMDDSDPDWYYAKPVTKLGEPGLVPKNYCEIEELPAASQAKKVTEDPEKARRREEEAREKEERERKKAELKQKEKEEKEKEKLEKDRKKEEERVEKEKRKEEERIEKEKRKEEERKRREEEARIYAEKVAAEKAAFRAEYGAPVNDGLERAKVISFEKKNDKKYYFVVEVYRNTGMKTIYRTYQDFYDFHVRLLDCFPDEAGENSQRIIPYLPGQKLFVNEAVSKQRRAELDQYCAELMSLPPRIINTKIVADFFQSRGLDDVFSAAAVLYGGNRTSFESSSAPSFDDIPPPPSRRPPPPGQGVISQESKTPPPWSRDNLRSTSSSTSSSTSPTSSTTPAPQKSSFGAQKVSAGPPRPAAGPPRPSAGPPRPAAGPPRPSSNPPAGNPRGPPPAMAPRPDNFQAAAALPAPAPAAAAAAAAPTPAPAAQSQNGAGIKVKVIFKDNVVVFSVPFGTKYAQVKDKAFKKLGVSPKLLQFKDEDGDMVTINGDDDLMLALDLTPDKLVLYVA